MGFAPVRWCVLNPPRSKHLDGYPKARLESELTAKHSRHVRRVQRDHDGFNVLLIPAMPIMRQSRFQRVVMMRFQRVAQLCLAAMLLAISLAVANVLAQESNAQSVEESIQFEAEPTDFKSDILEWVDELDAPSLATRKAAEKSLIEAGPQALKFLPDANPGASIEAIERLARVRKALTETKTEEQASAIVVHLDQAETLGEGLEAISRDSGVEFEFSGDESVPIQTTSAPLSFWHSVDMVLDQADLDINFYGGDRTMLQLVGRQADRPSRVDSAAYAGVYRIEPTSVTSRRELRQSEMSGLNIGIEISWEPRLTPIGLTIPISQLSGRLDDGALLKPQQSGDTIDIATNSDIAFSEFFFPMQLPAGKPQEVTSLSGVIRALLPGKMQTFEIPTTDVGRDIQIDSMTVRIEEIRKNGPLHEVRISIKMDDPGRALESHRHWILENEVFMKRKDESRADHLTYELYRQSADGVGVGYLFDLGDNANQCTLIYKSPTAVINNEVPFVIQDIPLP